MHRRTYLAASVLSLTGLAGCTADFPAPLGDDDPEGDVGDDPEATVRAFVNALDSGDRARANELIHTDSPRDEVTEDSIARGESVTFTVRSTELVGQADDRAAVRAELTLSDGSESRSYALVFELRTEVGRWRIWDQRPPSADDETDTRRRPPQVTWGFTDRPDSDAVTITHQGGDRIENPALISALVDGTTVGTLHDVIGNPVSAGDSGTVGVPPDTADTLLLVWESEDDTAVLAQHEYDVR